MRKAGITPEEKTKFQTFWARVRKVLGGDEDMLL